VRNIVRADSLLTYSLSLSLPPRAILHLHHLTSPSPGAESVRHLLPQGGCNVMWSWVRTCVAQKKWEQERIPNSMQRAYDNPLNNLDEFGACQGANALPQVWKRCVSESGWNCSALFSPATAAAFPSFWIFPVRVVPGHPNVSQRDTLTCTKLTSLAWMRALIMMIILSQASGHEGTNYWYWVQCRNVLKEEFCPFNSFSWLPD